MQFELIFPGKTKESYIRQGIDIYVKRLCRHVKVDFKIVREHKGKGCEQAVRDNQSEELLKNLSESTLVMGLDCRGRQYSSEGLAELITGWENQGRVSVAVVIGGPLGLSRKLLDKADYLLSLSRMTFTHEMVRLIFLEQLYRAYSIKAGSNYHK
ncbi:MAG: 23S rRNA (pseudouridine(1915)-N(3))-methyltransferase RlmH [Thermodesulfobacteriota bacterium]